MPVLFSEIVFGPIKSRRFGISLGINLLPLDSKVCNFNCIYCECGWTDLKATHIHYFSYEDIAASIEDRFKEISANREKIDSITFAGNGEPTMHPKFAEIMEETVRLRDKYLKGVKITVLSNGALLGKAKVFTALQKVDQRVIKLDAGTSDMLHKIDMPLSDHPLEWYIQKLKQFNGDLIIQTIFLKGLHNDQFIDNTHPDEVEQWIKALKEINPRSVMIYTIDRETPAEHLHKIEPERLNEICNEVKAAGIEAKVYL